MSQNFLQQRAEPKEWGTLLAITSDACQQDIAMQPEALHGLFTRLDHMSLLDLDRNRYFAMGQNICELAKRISQPHISALVVEAGAALLTYGSAKNYSGGISGLSKLVINHAFANECFQAYTQLPKGVQLLGDYLHIVFGMRRDKPEFYSSLYYEHGAFGPNYIQAQGEGSGTMVSHLNAAVASATSLVFAEILAGPNECKKRVDIDGGELPDSERIEALRHPSVVEVAEQCAALRFGRFLKGVGGVVVPKEDGTTAFNRGAEQVDTTHDETDSEWHGWLGRGYFIRDKSIVCPAATIEGVIPLVAGIVADMIETSISQRTIPV